MTLTIANPLFPLRTDTLILALLVGAGAAFPVAPAAAAPGDPKPGRTVAGGIHVQRKGDMPEMRATTKMLVDAGRLQCDSPLMKQTCRMTLSDPAASPKKKARCLELLSGFKLVGDLNSVGEIVIDEYFAPSLNRSARVVKTSLARQTGVCSVVIEQQEKREIVHYRPTGHTRYERKQDKSGSPYWLAHEHTYSPGLADMLKTAFDAAQLSGKLAVSAPLGHKTLVPGRVCETRRISAGAVEFVSCIHATGIRFPSHVTFESETLGRGKTERVEKFVSYAHDQGLSYDLFFPNPREKILTEKDLRSRPDSHMKKWCAAEKARTGVDPCEDDDE